MSKSLVLPIQSGPCISTWKPPSREGCSVKVEFICAHATGSIPEMDRFCSELHLIWKVWTSILEASFALKYMRTWNVSLGFFFLDTPYYVPLYCFGCAWQVVTTCSSDDRLSPIWWLQRIAVVYYCMSHILQVASTGGITEASLSRECRLSDVA